VVVRITLYKTLPLVALLICSVALLAGCANHSNAYLKNNGSTPNLNLSYHHKTNVLDNDYPLPARHGQGKENPDLMPPGLDLSQYHTHHRHKHSSF
jgi:uncharacterized lipoprotein